MIIRENDMHFLMSMMIDVENICRSTGRRFSLLSCFRIEKNPVISNYIAPHAITPLQVCDITQQGGVHTLIET